MKTTFSIFVAFLAGLLIGVSSGDRITERLERARAEKNVQESGGEQETRTASIMFDFGDDALRAVPDVSFTEGETLFALLKRVTQQENFAFEYKEYEGLGTLITKIGEKENSADGAYWQYWVNNRYAEVGADRYMLKPDDVILWKFTRYQNK